MAKCKTFTYKSATGQELDAILWTPEGEYAEHPKGVLQFIHGMVEHLEMYEGMARYIADAGYVVTGETHLGHGPKAKILGYFADKDGWDTLLKDIHTLRCMTEKEYPDLPYFIIGHSMGSFLTRCYLQDHSQKLSGAVVVGTGNQPKAVLQFGIMLSSLLCAMGKAKQPSRFFHDLSFKNYNSRYENVTSASAWITRDNTVLAERANDPYCDFYFTVSGYRDMFHGIKRMMDQEKTDRMAKELPVLFISGDMDPVGSYGKEVNNSADSFRKAGLKDVTVKLYPGARHDLFHETNRIEVLGDITVWLDKHLKKQ